MSHLLEFGMTGPLDESISCILKRVDPWVHALTFRGLHVLTFSGPEEVQQGLEVASSNYGPLLVLRSARN